jgi:hypothetical protein
VVFQGHWRQRKARSIGHFLCCLSIPSFAIRTQDKIKYNAMQSEGAVSRNAMQSWARSQKYLVKEFRTYSSVIIPAFLCFYYAERQIRLSSCLFSKDLFDSMPGRGLKLGPNKKCHGRERIENTPSILSVLQA